jgi:hypothetical protein
MGTEHTGSHRFEAGDMPAYIATTVPRFRHKAPRYMFPRYWTVLASVWLACFGFGVHDLVYSVHGPFLDDWNAEGFKTSLMWFGGLWLTTLLWKSWHREEQYPELLPEAEWNTRFPPGPGDPPSLGKRYQR